MKLFTVYSPTSGAILRSGVVSNDADAALQAGTGEAVLLDERGGILSQRVALPPEVVEPCIAPIVAVLAELKDDAKAATAQRRWEVETGGMNFGGSILATDDRSKLLLTQAAAKAEADSVFTTEWKAADNSWVMLDAATLIAARDAMFAHVQNCFSREKDIDALIDSSADSAALAALGPAIQAFWP